MRAADVLLLQFCYEIPTPVKSPTLLEVLFCWCCFTRTNMAAATTAYSATSTSSTGHAGRSTVSTRHCVAASTVNPPSSRQSTSTVANHGKSDTRRQGEALPPRQTTAPSMHCGDVSNLAASCSPRRSWQDTPPAKRHCAASLSVRAGVRHSAHDPHQRTEIGQRVLPSHTGHSPVRI